MGKFVLKLMRKMQDKTLAKRLSGDNGKLYLDKIDPLYNIPYIDDGSQYHTLDVYSPKGAEGKLPTVIVMHGGGYVACCKETNLLQSRYFATRGFRVVNINYRLMPEVYFKEVMQDLFTVFHWVNENSEKYGFDTEKVFLTGDSAGGHFVLLAAAILTSEKLRGLYEVSLPNYKLDRIAATCPAVSTKLITEPTNPVEKALSSPFGKKGIAALNAFPYSDMYEILDMCDYPRVLINTCETDALLYETAKAFHEYLNEKGIDHIYKEYEGKSHKLDHVFNVTYPDWEESIEANEDIISYFLTGDIK